MVNVNDFGRITKGKWYYLCCLLLLAVCLLPCLRADAADSDFGDRVDGMAEIQGLRMSNTEDKTRIVIDADQAVTYKKFALRQPDREVVDIPNAWLSPKLKREYTPKSHYVSKIRIAQFDKTTVRLVVEHKVGADNIKVFSLRGGKTPMRIVLDFGNLAPDSSQAKIALPDVKPAPKPQAKPVPKPQAKPQPKPVKPAQPAKPAQPSKPAQTTKPAQPAKPAAQPEPQQPASTLPAQEAAQNGDGDKTDDDIRAMVSLEGRKITIDPGHGGNDSGAIGPTGIMEKNLTMRISNELRRLLVAQGATVYMTRTTDTEVSPKHAAASDIEELQARCDVANEAHSDIFVCIHMDSFTGPAARGTTGYYYALGSQQSRDLADKIRQGVIDQLGTQSRGTQSCNFYVLKHTDMPATLVEVAFVSNLDEEQLLNSEAGIRKAAQGIADGIADYFG